MDVVEKFIGMIVFVASAMLVLSSGQYLRVVYVRKKKKASVNTACRDI